MASAKSSFEQQASPKIVCKSFGLEASALGVMGVAELAFCYKLASWHLFSYFGPAAFEDEDCAHLGVSSSSNKLSCGWL